MVLKKSKFGKNTGNTQRKSDHGNLKSEPCNLQDGDFQWLESLNKFERADIVKFLSQTTTKTNTKRNSLVSSLKLTNHKLVEEHVTSIHQSKKIKRKHQKRQITDTLHPTRRPIANHKVMDAVKHKQAMIFANNKKMITSTTESIKKHMLANAIRPMAQQSFLQKMSDRHQKNRKRDFFCYNDGNMWDEYETDDDDLIGDIQEELVGADEMKDIAIEAPKPRTISLGDFDIVPKAKQLKAKSKAKRVPTNDIGVKKNVHLIERPIQFATHDPVTSTILDKVKLTFPLVVEVETSFITGHALDYNYGKKYCEGQSQPRKFVIFESLRVHSAVVLTEVIETDAGMSKIRIKVLGLKILNHVSISAEKANDFDAIVATIFLQTTHVKEVKTPSVQLPFFLPRHIPTQQTANEDLIFAKFIANEKEKTLNSTLVDEGEYVFVDGQVCRICASPANSFTTLTKCGHHFCDGCVKRYLKENLKSPPCMQHDCTNQFDMVTVMHFLDANQQHKYCYNKLQHFINEQKRGIKYCPTPGCNRVAFKQDSMIRDTDETISLDTPQVLCGNCNKRWCFRCQEPHWPLSCNAFQTYQNYKHEFLPFFKDYENNLAKLHQALKVCPNCGILIEKHGGCGNVYCTFCNTSFHWSSVKAKAKGELTHLLFSGRKTLNKALSHRMRCTEMEEKLEKFETEMTNARRQLFDLIYECNALVEAFEVVKFFCVSRYEKKRCYSYTKQLVNFIKVGDSVWTLPRSEDRDNKAKKLFHEVKSFLETIFTK